MKQIYLKMMLFVGIGFGQSALASGLYVCNLANEHVWISYVSYEGGQWISHVGNSVQQGGCTQLTSTFTNTRYYLYMVGSSGKEWGANYQFCLPDGSNTMRRNADNLNGCGNVKNFFSVWVPDLLNGQFPDHYVHVVNGLLYGPSNLALNHPRA